MTEQIPAYFTGDFGTGSVKDKFFYILKNTASDAHAQNSGEKRRKKGKVPSENHIVHDYSDKLGREHIKADADNHGQNRKEEGKFVFQDIG